MTTTSQRPIPREQSTAKLDARVEDYLNDKLQTAADLDNIETLLSNVQNQQVLLKKQLEEADQKLLLAQKASREHDASVLKEIEAFKQKQADIDRRLLILTGSETSDDAAARFQETVDQIQRLDVAVGYIQLLKEADDLRAKASHDIRISPQAALEPYVRLKRISKTLKVLQPAAEDAAPHLIAHVEGVCDDLWKEMKDTLGAEFEATLKKTKWPNPELKLDEPVRLSWQGGVQKLLELQDPELVEREEILGSNTSFQEPLALLPLDVMIRPLELRFRYHFEGNRPTNRLDKPEYFMSHILGLLDSYNPFFSEYLQPILTQHFRNSDLASNPLYVDATSALITALLPMLRRKVAHFLPEISGQPQLLSHFIHELNSFDASLRDEWGYEGGDGADGWKGLTWEVLAQKDWFAKWLQVENDFALSRYQNIIDSKDAREIDYDSVDPGVTKPTKAAIRVNDLLETITDRYKPLASFSQKLRFLIDIQIAIFDKFHSRLYAALEAYLAATSRVVRAVQGVSKEDRASVEGVNGLESLCRIYGSAEYLEKAMGDWSDDILFLELWDELQDRARQNSANQSTTRDLAGPGMSVAAVAERTSSAVGSQDDSAGGALFDETAAAYNRLRVRTEDCIVSLLAGSARDALRPYTRMNPWASLDADFEGGSVAGSRSNSLGDSGGSSNNTAATSAELDGLLQLLHDFLSFLAPVLAQAPLRRIGRQLCLAIQTHLWDYVLMRHSFSAAGAAQLRRDVRAVCAVVDTYVGKGQGEVGMRRLGEGVLLLTLPSGSGLDVEGDEDGGLTLEEVERKMFESNEKAREVLEVLGLVGLTEAEARGILERRVELGN